MKTSELSVMRHLRTNARETLTKMSRKTGIPVSTIYEWLKQFENGVIKKHTCLLDFRELGYDLRVTILLSIQKKSKEAVKSFLENHHRINTIYRINNGYDYLIETVFKNMSELQLFLDTLDERGIKERKEYYILEEIMREAFLTSDAHMKLLAT